MTETAASSEDAAAARALEQARLRKERREAKIRAGGASRLNKITGLGGGLQRETELTTTATPDASSTSATTNGAGASPATETKPRQTQPAPHHHADPDEVDISQHDFVPRASTSRPDAPSPDAAALRQLMMSMDRPGAGAGPGLGGTPPPGMDDDPMMRMMMQMMGGGPGGGGASGPGGNPFPFPFPGGAGANNPFGMPPSMMGQQQPEQEIIPDRYASLWRLLHTAVALGLGLYIALWTTFRGTRAEREQAAALGAAGVPSSSSGVGDGFDARRFVYMFATAEAVLLTTRFFVDRGRATRPTGVMWSVASFLPQPVRGYLEIGLRYGQIFSTVRSDVLVCIFVLGVCSWLRAG